jgi:hypothetical protein
VWRQGVWTTGSEGLVASLVGGLARRRRRGVGYLRADGAFVADVVEVGCRELDESLGSEVADDAGMVCVGEGAMVWSRHHGHVDLANCCGRWGAVEVDVSDSEEREGVGRLEI